MDITTINSMTADEMREELLRQHAQGFYTREGRDVLPKRRCGCTEENFMAGISSPAFVNGYWEADRMLAEPQDGDAKPGWIQGLVTRFRSVIGGA